MIDDYYGYDDTLAEIDEWREQGRQEAREQTVHFIKLIQASGEPVYLNVANIESVRNVATPMGVKGTVQMKSGAVHQDRSMKATEIMDMANETLPA